MQQTYCSGCWQDPLVGKLFKRMDEIRSSLLEQQTELVGDDPDDDDNMFDMEGEGPGDDAPPEAGEGFGGDGPSLEAIEAPETKEPAMTEAMYDPPLHRYRSKASTTSLMSCKTHESLTPSETTNFDIPDMTAEEKEELAAVLEKIKLLEFEPQAHLKPSQ